MTQKRQFCPQGHDTFIFGRDSSYRCRECRRLDGRQARAEREAEAQAARHAEWKRHRVAVERQQKREHERKLAAGGDIAAEARWQELWSDTLMRTGHGLCQWSLENGHPGACTRVVKQAGQVYCRAHNREVFGVRQRG